VDGSSSEAVPFCGCLHGGRVGCESVVDLSRQDTRLSHSPSHIATARLPLCFISVLIIRSSHETLLKYHCSHHDILADTSSIRVESFVKPSRHTGLHQPARKEVPQFSQNEDETQHNHGHESSRTSSRTRAQRDQTPSTVRSSSLDHHRLPPPP
jgi:hypothetical protein